MILAAVRPSSTAAAASVQTPAPAIQVIELKATKYEFTPGKVDIPIGTTVQFKITAVDHDHGFEIEGVKDSCVTIKKGETKTVEYKATTAGKVSFKCCHLCGIGHGKMKGEMTVK
ncbi:MAG TPA: cupredoxin domain-containing protein [Vicinamibacterales bacterium]|nr:cupredoxin domain-containing protein [Vicinamibacterales bacterium]